MLIGDETEQKDSSQTVIMQSKESIGFYRDKKKASCISSERASYDGRRAEITSNFIHRIQLVQWENSSLLENFLGNEERVLQQWDKLLIAPC